MKDVYQVLRQKEMELARVRCKIEELRSMIPPFAGEPTEPTKAIAESSLMSGCPNKWFLEPDAPSFEARSMSLRQVLRPADAFRPCWLQIG